MRAQARILVWAAALTLVSAAAHAQSKQYDGTQTHCDPVFNTDVSALMDQPDGTLQTFAGDCSGDPGCNDYFDITCDAGDTFTVTFCQGGGGATFDTGLSVWSGAGFLNLDQCNDDACPGLLSEVTVNTVGTDTLRVRIGAFLPGTEGPYTMAYQAPTSCIIGQAGACCFFGGGCTVLNEDECGAQGGTYQGDFVSCDDAACPIEGACCAIDGSCTETTEDECDAADSDYQGDGVSCDEVECPVIPVELQSIEVEGGCRR